ncbi:unnamed protein product [Trichogramma brassicae]|uniref:Reverse transcriptase domain-containing protein n=1 Tax=Trichogramma brassicae TaxID=86971 RepID=A0A6H5J4S6_9HYME|nr:unnamed protein product [Trichogramma brassicae]
MMRQMLDEQREARIEMRDIGRRVDALAASLTERMDAIDKVQAESQARIEEHTQEINRLKTVINTMEENAMYYTDMCEIRFSTLPDLPDMRDTDKVSAILGVLKCNESISRVVSVRRWTPRSSTDTGAQAGSALVARFASPVARDAVMSCSHRLATVTEGSIFGTGGQGKIFATPMLTPPLYKLWCSALARAKELNYARPLLKGPSVCMCATPTSRLVKINNPRFTGSFEKNWYSSYRDSKRKSNAHQFGFRPGRSTQTAILDLTESIRQAIDKRKVSIIVSFDFSKAFDTIPHSLLIEKLRRIGCAPPTLGWFASYLTGRSQAIRLADGSHSSFVASTAGVPQVQAEQPFFNIRQKSRTVDYNVKKFKETDSIVNRRGKTRKKTSEAEDKFICNFPDFSRKFIVTTDASNFALGALLSQGKIGSDLPVGYASRALAKAELNYAAIEKELLAIVFAVQHFRPYLYGRKFTIVTDHKPLVVLHYLKSPTSRLARWKDKLRDYDYEIVHKPGRVNANADALSQNPIPISSPNPISPRNDDYEHEIERRIFSINCLPEVRERESHRGLARDGQKVDRQGELARPGGSPQGTAGVRDSLREELNPGDYHRAVSSYRQEFHLGDLASPNELRCHQIRYAIFSYNTSTHTAHGFTPHELVFARKARVPSEFADKTISTTYNDIIDDIARKLNITLKEAHDKIIEAKQKSKAYYDLKSNQEICFSDEGDASPPRLDEHSVRKISNLTYTLKSAPLACNWPDVLEQEEPEANLKEQPPSLKMRIFIPPELPKRPHIKWFGTAKNKKAFVDACLGELSGHDRTARGRKHAKAVLYFARNKGIRGTCCRQEILDEGEDPVVYFPHLIGLPWALQEYLVPCGRCYGDIWKVTSPNQCITCAPVLVEQFKKIFEDLGLVSRARSKYLRGIVGESPWILTSPCRLMNNQGDSQLMLQVFCDCRVMYRGVGWSQGLMRKCADDADGVGTVAMILIGRRVSTYFFAKTKGSKQLQSK